ncbi:MAG: metallophosphoesterase [Chitinophagaceae bacterium]|nr:metallophosphoesterase [Chitinophagaceae bacterium]
MTTRRSFLKTGSKALLIAGMPTTLMAAVNRFAPGLKLRIAIVSDGHYGQPKTDYKTSHQNLLNWMYREYVDKQLDAIVFNGDLVHDDASLFGELKSDYLGKMTLPLYAVPGNHDHMDTDGWKAIFGHPDNHSFEMGNAAFIMANTSNPKGEYLCPNDSYIKKQLERYRRKKSVFLILHIPSHIWTPEQTFYTECTSTLSLLHQYSNVKAVFHGHDHSNDSVLYTGTNLPHFFSSHYGGSWGTPYCGYRILEIDGNDKITTYQMNATAGLIVNTTVIS